MGHGTGGHERLRILIGTSGDAGALIPLLRESRSPAFEIVTTVRIDETLCGIQPDACDAALVELGPPGAGRYEMLVRLHVVAPDLPVVAVADRFDESVALEALRQGADECLPLASLTRESLVRAICHAVERTRWRRHLEHLAHHDALTRLPNRLLLHDRIGQALEQARRNRQAVAVLFVDLDNFKAVNDTLGHAEGDIVLQVAADRLRASVRASDTVARVGGDEFAVVLSDVAHKEHVKMVAEKILAALRTPIVVGGRRLSVAGSVGSSLYPHDGEDGESLLRHADAAMYRAKEQGRDRHETYGVARPSHPSEWRLLPAGLRHALERGEFILHYQPSVDAAGRIVALEALIRWRHPDWGLLYPMQFVPAAEENGLIVEIGEWVLRTACAEARAWDAPAAAAPAPRVAVNLSHRQIARRSHLLDTVARVLGDAGLPPARLELEVAESAIMKDEPVTVQTLHELNALGVMTSIDAFGAGYSSFSRFKRFPISAVRIDRSFVRNVTANVGDAAIVSAIVSMAHGLGKNVVAEGVETAGQMAFVRDRQVDSIQGYYVSRPLPPDGCAALVHEARALPGPSSPP